ncbi:YggS family pyridoxal phosphate-dependent enzyme [Candidatus Sumerlaeota bacterium]|nr:YggS family pyridoxal phosphate-dependent enzyme [Candidatus Sumerlaeota bacterium]
MPQNRIAQNLEAVRRRIARAAGRAGRDPSEIGLVAVTKHQSLDAMRALIEAGHCVLAENRVQEAIRKIDAMKEVPNLPSIEWHMVGHLQTNKANKAVGRFHLFHGIDSVRLAEALQRAADRAGTNERILLEVNVSGEDSKYGISPDELAGVAAALRPLDRIRCLGLMTMAPYEAEPEQTRPVFRDLRELRDRVRDLGFDRLDLHHLSMGMTNDFEVAVEEGATLVRIGTALFE